MTVGEIRSILNKHFYYDSENDTYYLMDYHPYWHGHNPDFGDEDGVLLDFKKGYDSGITHFYKKLSYRLNRILDHNTNIWLCCVPSHSPRNSDSSVYQLIYKLGKTQTANLLKRTKEVEKLSTGGDRAIAVHANSIVTDTSISLGKDAIVVLMDDILTSGNSIKACKSILRKRKDVNSVISIVIAKTNNSKYSDKPEAIPSIEIDDELDTVLKTPKVTPHPVLPTQDKRKQSIPSSRKTIPKSLVTPSKGEPMTDHIQNNEVAKPTNVRKNQRIEDKARRNEKYRSRAEGFRYGFFNPWLLLIMSTIFLVLIALTINRRLYYEPLVYMFTFTPMALFWISPCSGIFISVLAFIIKGFASLTKRVKRFQACYYLSTSNRVLIMITTILIWVILILMTIWYNLGTGRTYEGPWEYCIVNIGHFHTEKDIYKKEINWVLNSHRCPRCRSRSIHPVSEYEPRYVPRWVYRECDDYFGGCRNVNINPVHECSNCGLWFKFNKEKGTYIPARETE